MKLYGVTLTYNEADIVPFVMAYHERIGFDKLIVYDNESTDNTVELLSKYPFVEIRTFKTNNTINDLAYLEIKNNAPYQFPIINDEDTWVYIGDFDEVLWYHGDFRKNLEELNNLGYTCYNGQMVQPVSDDFPNLQNGELVHEHVKNACFWGIDGFKLTLLKTNGLQKLEYAPGSHICSVHTKIPFNPINNSPNTINGFHLKELGYDRCFKKMKNAAQRLSDINKRYQFGGHYITYSNEINFKNMWTEFKNNSFPIEDILSRKVKWPEGAETRLNWIKVD